MLHELASIRTAPSPQLIPAVENFGAGSLGEPITRTSSFTDYASTPPASVVDEGIDQELAEATPSVDLGVALLNTPSTPSHIEEVHAEVTQADAVESCISKLHPAVRDFLENDLRVRFIAVRDLPKN